MADLLKAWLTEETAQKLDESRIQQMLTYADSETGLEVRCEIIEYTDYPAAEWVVYFRNNGDKDRPILENIQALDISIRLEAPYKWPLRTRPTPTYTEPQASLHEFVIHHSKGSKCHIEDFRPVRDMLGPDQRMSIGATPDDQTPSGVSLPFFNVEGPGGGMIVGIGWPDARNAEFIRDADHSLEVPVGTSASHFLLPIIFSLTPPP